MEQRSRAQKYQQLRQNLAVETETTVKSRDLSRYARKMESFQTPSTQEFQYEKQEPVMGSRSRGTEDYLKEIQKESEAIDQIIKANEEIMQPVEEVKPLEEKKPVASRAQKFASVFMLDEEEDEVVTPVVEEAKVEVQPVVEEAVVEPVVVEEPVVEEPVVEEVIAEEWFEAQPVEELPVVEEEEEDFDIDSYEEEVVIKDHFMEDILLEAKKYSVDKGQRAAIDTTATILSELTQTEQEPVAFDDLVTDDSFDSVFAAEIEGLLDAAPIVDDEEEVVAEEDAVEAEELTAQIEAIINDNITADFFTEDEVEEEIVPTEVEEFVLEEAEEVEEVQVPVVTEELDRDNIMELTMKLEKELIFREEILQKTSTMKLQLDEYETELNTVNKKMSHTNMVLNFVLILLILALFGLLGFIGYWALVDRGLLSVNEVESIFTTFVMYVGSLL